jgi:hypothetical protein
MNEFKVGDEYGVQPFMSSDMSSFPPWQVMAEMGGCSQLALMAGVLLEEAAPMAARQPSPLAWQDYRQSLNYVASQYIYGDTPVSEFCYIARSDANKLGVLRDRDLFLKAREGSRAIVIGQLERPHGASIRIFGFGELMRSRDWDLVSQVSLAEVRRQGAGLIAAVGIEIINGFGQVRSTAWFPFSGNWQPRLAPNERRDELRRWLVKRDFAARLG